MKMHLGSNKSSYVITDKSEFAGIASLAIIGAASIITYIAQAAYRLGRETREFEMKRGFKKYMNDLKKKEKKEEKKED